MKSFIISIVLAVAFMFSSMIVAEPLGDGVYAHYATFDATTNDTVAKAAVVSSPQSWGFDNKIKLYQTEKSCVVSANHYFNDGKYEVGWRRLSF